MSKKYDITFVGHMCYDEIVPFGGEARVAPGTSKSTSARPGKAGWTMRLTQASRSPCSSGPHPQATPGPPPQRHRNGSAWRRIRGSS